MSEYGSFKDGAPFSSLLWSPNLCQSRLEYQRIRPHSVTRTQNTSTTMSTVSVLIRIHCNDPPELDYYHDIPASLVGPKGATTPDGQALFAATIPPIIDQHQQAILTACVKFCAGGCGRNATTVISTPMSVCVNCSEIVPGSPLVLWYSSCHIQLTLVLVSPHRVSSHGYSDCCSVLWERSVWCALPAEHSEHH